MRCKTPAEVNGLSVLFCSFKSETVFIRLTHVRSREGFWSTLSFSYGQPAGGRRRLLGVGLSPGNAVISLSHSGEWREEVEKGAAALGSPSLRWEHFLHLPTSLCAAKMLKVSSKDALVITTAPLQALPSLICSLDLMRKELRLMKWRSRLFFSVGSGWPFNRFVTRCCRLSLAFLTWVLYNKLCPRAHKLPDTHSHVSGQNNPY